MGYVPLNNYNHDGGYKRIQSGPNHQGFIVLTSGLTAYGVNDGIVVPGSPLSGTAALGAWDYDSNWRYVPSTLPSQSGSLDPTPYNVSGALDTYDGTRIYTRDNVAGAQAASAIGPEMGKINPRGGALQPRADVTRPETYMYYGGAAPDNQDYSPYNTPDANSAAEGKTGGGVTHRAYESSLLTNVLGSQGTSDRSQWRYHQPVYCKTYTETRRSETPGLMSTPLRYVYRGSASSYNYNYGGELLANKGGFELLPYDDEVLGCPFPVGCPTAIGDPLFLSPGDVLLASPPCKYITIRWYQNDTIESIEEGTTYTIKETDIGSKIYYVVTYPDNSTDSSNENCFDLVYAPISKNWYRLHYANQSLLDEVGYVEYSSTIFDNQGNTWSVKRYNSCESANIHKVDSNANLAWSREYRPDTSQNTFTDRNGVGATFLLDNDDTSLEIFYQRWTAPNSTPSRIYRFTVDKATGDLLSTRTITYTPIDTIVATDTIINIVKFNNNYYMLQSKRAGTANNFSVCVHKFDANLNLIWVKQLKELSRATASDTCTTATDSFPQDFKEVNGYLVGCNGIGNFNRANPSAFILDLEGSLVKTLPYIRSIAGLFIQQFVYVPRAIDMDNDQNVYTIGGYESSPSLLGSTYGRVLVIKQNSTGQLVWATNLGPTISSVAVSGNISIRNGRQLYIINNKLVIAGVIEYSLTVPTTYVTFIAIINMSTGTIERAFRILSGPSISLTRQGQYLKISKMKQPTGFIVTTSVGYRFTFDINNLPNPGTYTSTGSPYQYTITDATLIQNSNLSELQSVTTGSCSSFPLVDPGIGIYYGTNTTISGIAAAPSGLPIISGVALVGN